MKGVPRKRGRPPKNPDGGPIKRKKSTDLQKMEKKQKIVTESDEERALGQFKSLNNFMARLI